MRAVAFAAVDVGIYVVKKLFESVGDGNKPNSDNEYGQIIAGLCITFAATFSCFLYAITDSNHLHPEQPLLPQYNQIQEQAIDQPQEQAAYQNTGGG